jgi:nucleoside-triphosphate--adenylate kinase
LSPGEPLVQREDDKAETVRARLEQYEKVTSPLVEYYKGKGLLESFAGTQSDVIYPKVREFLRKRTRG